ncbi:MAG: HD domain-containing protein [Ruminococcus sp.]|nr:HD domain-containing protein [Ruminococcus sp.]
MDNKYKYHRLSKSLQKQITNDLENGWVNPYKFNDNNYVRRDNQRDIPNLWRPTFIRDCDKILHLPLYNRYSDKTQVFSFYNNDDLSRRGLHVQLVSRIARNIGRVLGLNLDLIEAIALGHDIGHTPFGHAGERFLNELYNANTGRFFNHNVHSARVLDKMFVRNMTLQTLDGILCHNGEFEQQEYRPNTQKTFNDYDTEIEACYTEGKSAIERLVPCTLEGCVVRISDMIAYIGKDRQDAINARIISKDYPFSESTIGVGNAEMINNMVVDIIEHSYGKDYILLSEQAYQDLSKAKKENYEVIYKNDIINAEYEKIIKPMFCDLYGKLLDDLKSENTESWIFKHHIDFMNTQRGYYSGSQYTDEEPNQIVVDYIASMTDDYFVQLYELLFPDSTHRIKYHSYFE